MSESVWIELSHIIEDGLLTYPGLPEPRIEPWLSFEESRDRYAAGTEFEITRLTMIGNTGTYVDAPSHRFRGGPDIADLPLSSLVDLPGQLVSIPEGSRAIGPEHLEDHPLTGRAVLFHTGWSRRFGTPGYGVGHPHLTPEAARLLIDRRATLVGIDSLNVDDTATGIRPVHTALLEAGLPIVEHLTALSSLPESGFRFSAVPLRLRGMSSSPVRAFARLETE